MLGMPNTRRIGLALDGRDSFSRSVRIGACRYGLPGQDWVTRGVRADPQGIALLIQWGVDGYIVGVGDAETVAAVHALGKPAINIRGRCDTDLPRVGVDDPAIGRLAAEHYLDNGFTRFAFIGSATDRYADHRLAGFTQRLAAEGHAPLTFRGHTLDPADDKTLRDWLQTLPTATGVFAADDRWALRASELAREAGLIVPDDVALLGVDDDEMCRMTWPPLSSIALPSEKVGYEAARMLDRMIHGEPAPPDLLLPPLGVIARQSTALAAVDDPDVAAALRFIRENAHRPIGVPDVVANTTINRRWLEVSFRRNIGRTILQEVQRVRIDMASRLLRETDMSMAQIASATGIGSAQRLAILFGKKAGMTPTDYRRQFSLRPTSIAPPEQPPEHPRTTPGQPPELP